MKKTLAIALCSIISLAYAQITIEMHQVNAEGIGKSLGSVVVSESAYGLVFTPKLTDLEVGIHGFHIHVNPDCGITAADGAKGPALAAGGHFDPKETKKHDAPWGEGHLGDLPPLLVDAQGHADTAVLAPRIQKLDEIRNRALMIHVHGDNFSDDPQPLGGGGARFACGIIQ